MDNNIILGKAVLTNTGDVFTGTLNIKYTEYTDGGVYLCSIPITNTTATPTLNLNNIGAKNISGVNINGLLSGTWYMFMYNAILDKFILLNGNTFAITTTPVILGGASTTSSITYKTTTGVGTTGADHIFKVGNNGATEAMRILNNGNVGIGNSTPLSKLYIKDTAISTSISYDFIYSLGIITPTSSSLILNGSYNQININGTNSVTTLNGVHSNTRFDNTGSVSTLNGFQTDLRNLNIGTITSMSGLEVQTAINSGGGTVSNFYGVRVRAQIIGSTLNAGISLENVAATGRYNIYSPGTAQNYLAGNLGLGVTVPTAYVHLKAGTATAGTAPIKLTTGTVNTTAEVGALEYNNTFHLTNSDATRRHIVLAPTGTKITAAAPYTNDGYVIINIGGTDIKFMTTA